MVPSKRLISFALVFATLVVAQAAQPSLRDVLHGRLAAVSTASVQDDSYGYNEGYALETKEVCLQETEQKVCTWLSNCVNGEPLAALTGPTCITGQLWTSDFACCQERNYGYDSPSGLRNTQLWAGAASVGTCDWTILYADPDTLGTSVTANAGAVAFAGGEQAAITNNIWKLGTAFATCYLGPESESCGGPLCDRMVMAMQGTAYRAVNAYSHWGPSGTQDPTCFEALGPDQPLRMAEDQARDANGTTLPGARKPNRSMRRGVRAANRNPTAELQFNGGGGYYNGHDNNEQDVFVGEATIIMGVITSMAGQRKERWEEGVFEYVPFFQLATGTGVTQPITTGLDASVPWVRDKTYKLTFYKSGGKY